MVCPSPESTRLHASHLRGEDTEVRGDARTRPLGGEAGVSPALLTRKLPAGQQGFLLATKTPKELSAVLRGWNSTRAAWTKAHVGKCLWTPDHLLWKHTPPTGQLGRFSKVSLLMATQCDVSSKPRSGNGRRCQAQPERVTWEEGKLKRARVNKHLSDAPPPPIYFSLE